jgi:hypothetical protein
MADIYRPEKDQIEPKKPPAEIREMDAKLAEAEPAKKAGSSESPSVGDQAELKNQVADRQYGDAVEAESKLMSSEASGLQTISPKDEVKIEGLQSDTVYQKNDYEFKTDGQGRPAEVSGKLELEEGVRSPEQTRIGKRGEVGDEGGHLIATRFDGPSDAFNIVPQDANLNRGDWKEMENEWANNIKEGRDVKVLVEPVYDNKSIRPARFDVVYQVDDQIHQKAFVNKS